MTFAPPIWLYSPARNIPAKIEEAGHKKALLVDFLVQGLTSAKALQHLGGIVPETVPSGLPVAD